MTNVEIINLNFLVNNTQTNIEGVKLFCILDRAISEDRSILLEISNNMAFTSSFLNSSIGNVIDKYGVEDLKKRLKVKANNAQFNRLSDYIQQYNSLVK